MTVPYCLSSLILLASFGLLQHRANAFVGRLPFLGHYRTSLLLSTTQEAPAKSVIDAPIKINQDSTTYWELGATNKNPTPRPLTPNLMQSLLNKQHPVENQDELGRGVYVTDDWRKAWKNYQSPPELKNLIDDETGYAFYEIDWESDIEGHLPDDLVGTLYRNGAGKLGVSGERVAHVLDGDGLVFQINFPECDDFHGRRRKITFRSRFVATKGLLEDSKAGTFVTRGVFGTGRRGLPVLFPPPRNGINADPSQPPLLSRLVGNIFQTDLKNTANTHIVSFAGKLLALFEAGRPYALDPVTLETFGEDNLDGKLGKEGTMAIKLSKEIPGKYQPEFMGGAYHTAHPKLCPRTGHLVGWHYALLLPDNNRLQMTFTEWSPTDFSVVASTAHVMSNCSVAPHDMAITENAIIMVVNSLTMNQAPYLMGIKGPAACMAMDGRANVYAHVFPRPTSKNQFEPFVVEVPPSFSIHFSHAYEDENTGNLVAFFSGWPPSDSKDFLGAWGGYCPNFSIIPPTFIWRLEIDPQSRSCVDMNIAPGSHNSCSEHIVVHPGFVTKKANYLYAITSNLIGDSSAPAGYAKHCVEDGSTKPLAVGEFNDEIDVFWFGSRYFTDEPLVVPKRGGDPDDERDAYLLGMVFDAVKERSFLAIFDLQRDLKKGPICKVWLKSHIPHGLHGSFAADGPGTTSTFC